jgi:dUTP pyrophosphatase
MNRIAQFEKVSFNQFKQGWEKSFADTEDEIKDIYDKIKLPVRATNGSAGYDFFSPIEINLPAKETILIPSGIRVKIANGWFLGMFPKSGLGFKYRLQLDNTVGVIDSDYYYSDNEGHIFIKLTNDNNENKTLEIKSGAAVCQGIFLPFGITFDDNATGIRNGGLGSTAKE